MFGVAGNTFARDRSRAIGADGTLGRAVVISSDSIGSPRGVLRGLSQKTHFSNKEVTLRHCFSRPRLTARTRLLAVSDQRNAIVVYQPFEF